MDIKHQEHVSQVNFEHGDNRVQTLKEELEANGIRVVFADCPVIKDLDETVSMRTVKWNDEDPRAVYKFMFPVYLDPLSFESINHHNEYFDEVFDRLKKEVLKSGCKTFYFYNFMGMIMNRGIDDGFSVGWVFRGQFA